MRDLTRTRRKAEPLKDSKQLTFEFVIQADLESLVGVCLSLPTPVDENERLSLFYGQTIIHFLRGDTDILTSNLPKIRSDFSLHPERNHLEVACALRERIRLRLLDAGLLERAFEIIKEDQSVYAIKWRGEIAILLATSYTIFNDYQRAHEMFEIAARGLMDAGFIRKSLRAQMNVLVCESHIHPGKNLFTRYHDLYRQAIQRDRKEIVVATTCLLNISREYQRAGAYLAALKYCNRAIALFERQMGDLNYYLTLIHRAQILVSLGRVAEARIDVDQARLAPFKEVKAALQVIEPLIEGQLPSQESTDDLLPTWKERVAEIHSSLSTPKLSSLEERLLALLSRGPRDRIDLVDDIYGDRLDAETKQNRFKSLIGTFRKKCPDLIVYDNGRYRLADQMLVAKNPAPRKAKVASVKTASPKSKVS